MGRKSYQPMYTLLKQLLNQERISPFQPVQHQNRHQPM